jgi:hypothetical protein
LQVSSFRGESGGEQPQSKRSALAQKAFGFAKRLECSDFSTALAMDGQIISREFQPRMNTDKHGWKVKKTLVANVFCKIVAERRRKLASHIVAGTSSANHRVLKRRWKTSAQFRRPFRTNLFWMIIPATMWLANFRRSFGAHESGGKNCFALD